MKKTNSVPEVTSLDANPEVPEDNVTPYKCFLSSIISGGFAFAIYLLFNSIVQTYAAKTITGTSSLAINIAAAVRTLVMGTVALATGIFTLAAVGLFLLGIQLTVQNMKKALSPSENAVK